MDLKPAQKITLNRYTHSVRASQAVIQFGVGAIVDFPNQTLMTAAPEYWQEQVIKTHDERLEKLLHVDYFGVPGGQDDPRYNEGVSYARFPEWYFCSKCRKFQNIKEWVKEYKERATQNQLDSDPNMVKYMRCPTCKSDLVVTRIVSVCEHGHIDDFPWIQWVHCQNTNGGPKPVCMRPKLEFKTSATSTEGLEGLTVTCEACKAKATLKSAFDKNRFEELEKEYQGQYNFCCSGRHPWKNTHEYCDKYPRALQRSSSSVYFPITASSLVIPPYSSLLNSKIENSNAFESHKNVIATMKKNPVMSAIIDQVILGTIGIASTDISLEIGVPADQIRPILERKWLNAESGEGDTTSVTYRSEEYEALSGNIVVDSEDYGDFLREPTDISKYGIPFVKNISLIHKIREVQALTGFSRIKPVEQGSEKAVSIKQPNTNWYPAYEVHGEGIFIEFDEAAIQKWISSNSMLQKRADILNENYARSYFGTIKPRSIDAKFLLLHTISHLLIKQLSFECGYSIASLKERLYCSNPEDGHVMSGILIYTASGDSEGTMGGLVRQGRADIFPGIYKKAMESAMTCSNDPVCSLSRGQGRDSLNLSACYSCSLIPETSCEEFNTFLDRGVVVGTYENRKIGFYYDQLYGGKPWNSEYKADDEDKCAPEPKVLIIVDTGIDISEGSLADIWGSLKEWSEDSNEIQLLSKLEESAGRFNDKEMPRTDCLFHISGTNGSFKCDLMWLDSKVALFTEDNEDSYKEANKSDWKCFLTSDPRITVDDILASLKRK